MTNSRFVQGFLNQYISKLLENIPEKLLSAAEVFEDYDLEEEVRKIVLENLIRKEEDKTSGVDVLIGLDNTAVDTCRHKKKYYLDNIRDRFSTDMEKAKAGITIRDLTSPFCVVNISFLQNEFQKSGDKEEEESFNSRLLAIQEISDRVESWIESYDNKEGRTFRNGIEGFTGFVSYPFFSTFCVGDKKRSKAMLDTDLKEAVFRLSYTESFSDFAKYHPASLTGTGIYAEKGKKEALKSPDLRIAEISAERLRDTFFPDLSGEDVKVRFETGKEWGIRDMDMLTYLTSCSLQWVPDSSKRFRVVGNVSDLCKAVFPETKKLNGRHYEMMYRIFLNMKDTQIVASADGKPAFINVFDKGHIYDASSNMDVILDEQSEPEEGAHRRELKFEIIFSTEFSKKITEKQLDTLIRPQLEGLEDEVSRMIYAGLKRDRLYDLVVEKKSSHHYLLEDLVMMYSVTGSSLQKRHKYRDALEEMMEQQVLIKDHEESKDGIDIEWIPLSADELADIHYLKNSDELTDSTGKAAVSKLLTSIE